MFLGPALRDMIGWFIFCGSRASTACARNSQLGLRLKMVQNIPSYHIGKSEHSSKSNFDLALYSSHVGDATYRLHIYPRKVQCPSPLFDLELYYTNMFALQCLHHKKKEQHKATKTACSNWRSKNIRCKYETSKLLC